jgi:hypothetical protein
MDKSDCDALTMAGRCEATRPLPTTAGAIRAHPFPITTLRVHSASPRMSSNKPSLPDSSLTQEWSNRRRRNNDTPSDQPQQQEHEPDSLFSLIRRGELYRMERMAAIDGGGGGAADAAGAEQLPPAPPRNAPTVPMRPNARSMDDLRDILQEASTLLEDVPAPGPSSEAGPSSTSPTTNPVGGASPTLANQGGETSPLPRRGPSRSNRPAPARRRHSFPPSQ